MDFARTDRHIGDVADWDGIRLDPAMEDTSAIEQNFGTEVSIPAGFSVHLDQAIMRLAYLFPEFQVTRSDNERLTVQVRHATEIDNEKFTRELLHALVREKCRSEGQPLRRVLLEHIFER